LLCQNACEFTLILSLIEILFPNLCLFLFINV
jgi:hypothetical protein